METDAMQARAGERAENMSKELWIIAHEQLVDEYLEDRPEADWREAYEQTIDRVTDRAADNMADMIDHARMMMKGV